MDVPVRSLSAASAYARTARRRRVLFFGATAATAVFGGALMANILLANGLTPLEGLSLLLFCVLFAWISGAFWTAVAGFGVRLWGRDPAILDIRQVAGRTLRGRTAIVMPICEEDPRRVAAGVCAVWRPLARHRQGHAFDFFMLSDTRTPATAAAEEKAWSELVADLNAQGRLFYRRRPEPTGRKVGNIDEFVESRGAAYDYFIVLDADSVMSAEALVTLAGLMDAHPDVGIIQTLPLPVGGTTRFARILQFAARLNGPMMASGLAFWQLGEGNYWGHNAILRMRPFAESCTLPILPGHGPLGGEILSHDFVEAAFMRRAGYAVWLAPDIEGSWEEIPSNVIDYASRDRRWAQGNLQHLRLLSLPGLHWMSRLHMLTGVMAYASSLAWLALLMVSTVAACPQALLGHEFFESGTYALFPDWPEFRTLQIFSLLAVTAVVLLLPKALGLILALADPKLRRGFGGVVTMLRGIMAEQFVSMLFAPAMMLFHSTFVVATLAGRRVGWSSQHRGDRHITLGEALERHKWHVLFGAVWGGTVVLIAPAFVLWLLPVLAGLLYSAPITASTSHTSTRDARRLFLTPEESETPAELALLAETLTGTPSVYSFATANCAGEAT
jgi:membrane glycosyltransferase